MTSAMRWGRTGRHHRWAASHNDAGKYTVVMKRLGGVWKVAYAIYNSDTPPTAKPTPNP